MLVLFIDYVYRIKENSWCEPVGKETFPNLSEAKRQCSKDPSCAMFYDLYGRGNKFFWCSQGAEIKRATSGSILHIKGSEYIYICAFYCHTNNHIMVKLILLNHNIL